MNGCSCRVTCASILIFVLFFWVPTAFAQLICDCCTPIVIAIDNSPYELTTAGEGVRFDIDADGTKEQVAWTAANQKVGFLILDRNGDGIVNDGTELFGNSSSQPPSEKPNGFLALSVFDNPTHGGNSDGFIDSSDLIYQSLGLWFDSNHDGISQASEVKSLKECGVASISLRYQLSARTDGNENKFFYRATLEAQKGFRVAQWAYDVFLTTE